MSDFNLLVLTSLNLNDLFPALKAFIKPFEAPQRNVEKKFNLIFSLCLGLGC